ncbi:nucleoid-associated protein, partial [Acinetobacter baumannii]
GLNYDDRKGVESRAYDFLKSASQANAPINLEHLANTAAPEDSENLRAYLASDELLINDGFVPDGRSLKKLLELTTKSSY